MSLLKRISVIILIIMVTMLPVALCGCVKVVSNDSYDTEDTYDSDYDAEESYDSYYDSDYDNGSSYDSYYDYDTNVDGSVESLQDAIDKRNADPAFQRNAGY